MRGAIVADPTNALTYQRTGSYKIRRPLKFALLSEDEKARGVICSSAGNHAQGVALDLSNNELRESMVSARLRASR
jgi:hypothetical protein